MCGRYTLSTDAAALVAHLGLDEAPAPAALRARYNIAPSQDVPVVRCMLPELPEGQAPAEESAGGRRLRMMRWGLIPSWAKDPRVGYRMINARAETAAQKPAFRAAARRRRCLIPADGFYEWQPVGKRKQPHLIRLRDGRPFAFAGLWECWRGGGEGDGRAEVVVESCTILTCEPNEVVRPLHDRMPVILAPADYERWLDPELRDLALVADLLRPFPAAEMTAHVVGDWVSNPRLDDPRCAEPLRLLPGLD